MKIFNLKSFSKKLMISLILVVFLSTAMVFNTSYAGIGSLIGGTLIQPVGYLLIALGDGLMSILQKSIFGIDGQVTIDISGKQSFWEKAWGFIKFLGVVAIGALILSNFTVIVTTLAVYYAILGKSLSDIGASILSVGEEALETGVHIVCGFSGNYLPDVTMFPMFSVGPEEIFEGKIVAFDINFFSPKEVKVDFVDENGDKADTGIDMKDYDTYTKNHPDYSPDRFYYYDDNGKQVETSRQNTAADLSGTISKWYYNIRNIAIVFMMLILVYIGIRMMLCSIASEKSKYKKMLSDWVVSICLVFVLQYIMVFAVNINEKIIKIISEASGKKVAYDIIFDEKMEKDRKENFVKSMAEVTGTEYNENYLNSNGESFLTSKDDATKHVDEIFGFQWITNLMGQARLSAQNENGTTEYIGYSLAYVILVFYTIYFSFTYLKRVLYMAFLTIISPLVAMTYSIDKIADGKAQAFNMWLKEYIFNLLIQPMHLILYIVLVSMAFDLAGKSIIYTLVAIGFMIPAEKFVRQMFGFEKARTPGILGGAAGAALTMKGIQKLGEMHKPELKEKEKNTNVESLDKSKDIDDSISGKGLDYLGQGINDETGNSNNIDSQDPRKKAEKEALEEKIADGQITEDELTQEQKILLGLDKNKQGGDADRSEPTNNTNHQIKINGARSNSNSIKRMPRKVIRGVKRAAKSKPVRFVAKGTTKAMKDGIRFSGALLGAGIGAAAGIASGDISKVGQYTALGASAGNSMGKNFTGNVSNKMQTAGKLMQGAGNIAGNVKDGIGRKRYGKAGYEERIKQQKLDDLMEDKETKKFFEKEFYDELKGLSGKERKDKLNGYLQNYRQYADQAGVVDKTIVAKAMRLDPSNPASKRNMAAAMLAKQSKGKDVKSMESSQKKLASIVGQEEAQRVADNAAKINGFYK